jgi:hypothetical protein
VQKVRVYRDWRAVARYDGRVGKPRNATGLFAMHKICCPEQRRIMSLLARTFQRIEPFSTVQCLISVEPDAIKRDRAPASDDQIFMEWTNIPTWSKDGIEWEAPSAFSIARNGNWSLTVSHLGNFYNSYGVFDRHFSVRWWWAVQYKGDTGSLIYQAEYPAGDAGYQGETCNVVRRGQDPGILDHLESIRTALGWQVFASYY